MNVLEIARREVLGEAEENTRVVTNNGNYICE